MASDHHLLHDSFFNLHTHGLVRCAVGVPRVHVADPEANLRETLELISQLAIHAPSVIVFPELGLSAYTIDDLVQQSALLEGIEKSITHLLEATRDCPSLIFVGAPVRAGDELYNVALALHKGRLLAAFPKTYLPNYREFYEKRYFTSSTSSSRPNTLILADQEVPFGSNILLCAHDLPGFVVHAEICEDAWSPIPPSTYAALAGARILVNLSASNITVEKSDYRHTLAESHSARCLAAYLYSASGYGESSTDLAWDGQAIIYENGHLLAESERFLYHSHFISADIDLERLGQERLRQTSFKDTAHHHCTTSSFRKVHFTLGVDKKKNYELKRAISRFPYLPKSEKHLSELCYETYNIQSQGLCQRLESSGIKHVILGVSGGLDSTHALLVAAHAFDLLKLPRKNIFAFTLPIFGTSTRTHVNALELMEKLDVTGQKVDLTPACERMLSDIGHPWVSGQKIYDTTFENVQAGARTSFLFRAANLHKGLVLGTGDLSELALGWCTYGVGDHMAHYNVNASVPKTLIQNLIHWVAIHEPFCQSISTLLQDILDTDISPELVPRNADESTPQRTEDIIGPYNLQDFTLFYTIRYGFSPSKIAFLAYHAWKNVEEGIWPPHVSKHQRVAYDLPTIKKWLQVFVRRFFQDTQFKRSALPNGPKVSSGGSLSPRGDWRAPSDSHAALWLEECKKIP